MLLEALHRARWTCHYVAGGDAPPGGTYLCPDGSSSALLVAAAFALTVVLVLAGGLALSGRRGRERFMRRSTAGVATRPADDPLPSVHQPV